ncbi:MULTISPECIES: LacI family DNA-binding transcriptional regulator [unclassified Microbacterium]|uniref:LacI family DNA-binding transcriptional regulator n=1 Tax=unclassified Microbacterium TaxID=2609290 RepID=UPI0012F7D2E1|nr:LacI family DNA-binding transcriptional regulator [Microbacterium sp. MAH-37]MVQ43432.1 DeoR family transcriptional regulator [Microbacterium sp. MAH-37]
MIAEERRERILREIVLRGRFEVADFARRTGLSGMTIRRDLAVLAERGLIRRVHGGAVLPETAEAPVVGSRGIGSSSRPVATVGLIVPDAGYYFPPMIRGAGEAAHAAGIRIVLGTTNYDPREEVHQLTRLAAGDVDAIMLITARPGVDDSTTWDAISGISTPVVLVERSTEGAPTALRIDSVRSDHSFGAELAVDHLAERGHDGVGLLLRETATAPWVALGHARATRRHGMRTAPVATAPSPRWGDGSTSEVLRTFLEDCLSHGIRSAIVLPDDLAVALLGVVEDRGLRVPDDFAIVAYDDEIASFAGVPLTAIAPPKREVGRRALEACRLRLEQRDEAPAQRIQLTPTINVREST